jgi:hypothetical protein
MKKDLTSRRVQKLELSRETLRDLTATDLRNAAGGATIRTCTDLCPSSTC